MVYYQEKISHRSGAHSTSGAEQRRYTILDPIEARIIQIIDAHRDELEAIAEDIYTHAEQGYHEYRTA